MDAVAKLFGTDTGAQKRTLAKQRAEVEAEGRRIGAIEAGQRRLRSGGSGGFRAYIDDQLKTLFGG